MAQWLQRLRDGLNNKDVRLPSGLDFEGSGDDLTIRLGKQALSANMQGDSAAFEAWTLAFLAHGGVRHVRLELPQAAGSPGSERHWHRLLYRLDRLRGLFPDAISVNAPPEARWPPLGVERFVLNRPLGHRTPLGEHLAMIAAALASGRESDVELAMELSPALKERFGFDKVMRQWPVGLFSQQVAAANHVFTGGKSAIDLIGVKDSTLFLFELKRAGNSKAGILSEMFFYASVMRDALGATPQFEFEDRRAPRNCAIGPSDFLACTQVEAVMLAPRFHPVVTPGVVDLLNEATSKRWTDPPVVFSAVEFAVGVPDFEFH